MDKPRDLKLVTHVHDGIASYQHVCSQNSDLSIDGPGSDVNEKMVTHAGE